MIGNLNNRNAIKPNTRSVFNANRRVTTPRTKPAEDNFGTTSNVGRSFLERSKGLSGNVFDVFRDFSRIDEKITELNTFKGDTVQQLNLELQNAELNVKLNAISAGLTFANPSIALIYKNLREVNNSALARVEEKYRAEKKSLKSAKGIRALVGGASIWASLMLL